MTSTAKRGDTSTTIRHRGRPPGPRGWPLVGSLLPFFEDPIRFMMTLGHDYGAVSFARLGPLPVYMVNEPRLIEEFLVGRYSDCTKDRWTRESTALVGNGLLTSEGDYWRRQRKVLSPPLQPKRITAYAETAADCAWRAFSTFQDGETRDIQDDMKRVTLEIVSKTLLGIDAQNEAACIGHVLDVFMEYFARQAYSWEAFVPATVPTPARRRMRQAVKELDAIVYTMIERCRKQDRDADHLLARLVNARDENGEAMSDVQLRDEAVTMLLAGHETSTLALSYAAHLLATHPNVAARLAREVDSFLEGDPGRARQLPTLKYLDAVVRESLRLYPPVYAIAREATRPFELGGYAIPKGATIMASQYTVQRDARLFEWPAAFRPDRWLSPDIEHLPRFAYLPFGGGPHVCIGNHFSMMEIAIVLGVLSHRVGLSVSPGFELNLKPLFTLRNDGVRLKVRGRDRFQAPLSDGRAGAVASTA